MLPEKIVLPHTFRELHALSKWLGLSGYWKLKNVEALTTFQRRDIEKSITWARRGPFRYFEASKIVRSRRELDVVVPVSSENQQHPEYTCSDPKCFSRRNTCRQRSYHKTSEEVEMSEGQSQLLCDYKKGEEMQVFKFKRRTPSHLPHKIL